MKIKIALAFLILSFLNGRAQEFKLGKVSIKELEEKVHPNDTTAAAAILFNKARTFFTYDAKDGFSIKTENTFRIKIYKAEGLKWANYKLQYRSAYETLNNDRVEFLDCVTYNIENGKIIKTKLNSDGSFKVTINKYWKEASITMPNVKLGSVIEFKYILKSENIVEFPEFNFQYDIPVNYSEYNTEIPAFFVYKAIKMGKLELAVESKLALGTLSYDVKYFALTSQSISFQQVNSKYVAKNIPPLKEESFVDNIENYRLVIHHELEKTQFYDEPVKDYSTTWEGVAKTIYDDKDFGKELKERDYIAQDVKRILKNVESKNEKMDIIFKFVQNKMNWDNKKGYYTDKGVKQAYLDGTGNTAEINFILLAMLNYGGINANPVLLSTVDNGVPVYPNRTIFNYVVAAADIDGKQILLDATNKNTTNNILPLYTLNWSGRLITQDDTSQEIKLRPNFLSKKLINISATVDDKGKISGQYSGQKTDYEAFVWRESNAGSDQQNYIEKVENAFTGIQIGDYSAENSRNTMQPIIEKFTFTTDNECEIIGDKMYINPLLFFTQTRNPFVQEKREFPIYFGYPSQSKYIINMQIPEGYTVESIPESLNITTGDDIGSFKFLIRNDLNMIQLAVTSVINSASLPADYYPFLKDFFQQMIVKQNEKIVLKKI